MFGGGWTAHHKFALDSSNRDDINREMKIYKCRSKKTMSKKNNKK